MTRKAEFIGQPRREHDFEMGRRQSVPVRGPRDGTASRVESTQPPGLGWPRTPHGLDHLRARVRKAFRHNTALSQLRTSVLETKRPLGEECVFVCVWGGGLLGHCQAAEARRKSFEIEMDKRTRD